MAEKNNEYFQQFIGVKVGPDRYRIKGKHLSNFAKSIGDKDPRYYVEPPKGEGEKADYSKIIAHPAYAATYTVPSVLMNLPEVMGPDGKPVCKNIGKILHTSQEYDYSGCVPLTAAEKKIYSYGEILDMQLKSDNLWVKFLFTTKNQEGTKTFCKAIVKGLLRKGGY